LAASGPLKGSNGSFADVRFGYFVKFAANSKTDTCRLKDLLGLMPGMQLWIEGLQAARAQAPHQLRVLFLTALPAQRYIAFEVVDDAGELGRIF
jgi:hypothetical protein